MAGGKCDQAGEMNHQSDENQRTPGDAFARMLYPKIESSGAKMQSVLPTPVEIAAALDRHIVGHAAAKKMLAVSCFKHLVACAAADINGGKIPPGNHCILAGPTGCGKSAMIGVLGDFLGVPILEINCAILSPSGYKGTTLNQHVAEFAGRLACGNKTSPAIVVWEEIDKLADDRSEAGRYRRMTQADALRFLDGAACGEEATLDASRILSIGLGAFEGLDRIRNPRTVPVIGFNGNADQEVKFDESGPDSELLPDHLIEFGLMPEFVGRFSQFAALDPIVAGTMKRIICESESSALLRRIAYFSLNGVRLMFDDDAVDVIVAMAMAHPTGARSLGMILNKLLLDLEFRLPDLVAEGVFEISFDKRAARGETGPVLARESSRELRESLMEIRRKAGGYITRPMSKG
ncbi:MAG: AAA family ATPase [Akkermansiaceae bacterium]|jgi:ATP-dependent Clp protease ATP-binding subunit ClpX|nr:AAA family ATPase [Akkermansiaceae bacterium]